MLNRLDLLRAYFLVKIRFIQGSLEVSFSCLFLVPARFSFSKLSYSTGAQNRGVDVSILVLKQTCSGRKRPPKVAKKIDEQKKQKMELQTPNFSDNAKTTYVLRFSYVMCTTTSF